MDVTDSELGCLCVKMEPWRFNALEVVFPRGRIAKDMSFSRRYGVVPRRAPTLRVERIRRVRCCELRRLVVGGGWGQTDNVVEDMPDALEEKMGKSLFRGSAIK